MSKERPQNDLPEMPFTCTQTHIRTADRAELDQYASMENKTLDLFIRKILEKELRKRRKKADNNNKKGAKKGKRRNA